MSRPSPQTDRVVQLLEFLADDPNRALTVAEISRRLEVHRASCHNMLTALCEAGWLLRDPFRKTYQLGPALVRLGRAAGLRFPAMEFARPAMEDLVHRTGWHCVTFTVDADHLTVVDQVRVPRTGSPPMGLGHELPLRPPYGAGVYAWAEEAEQAAWLDGMPDPARAAHRRAFAVVRERGYAVGLRVVPDAALNELAGLLRATDVGRRNPAALQGLAERLSTELLGDERWVPADLAADEEGEVTHVASPVFDREQQPVLLLALVPVRQPVTGTQVASVGQLLWQRAREITGALQGQHPGTGHGRVPVSGM